MVTVFDLGLLSIYIVPKPSFLHARAALDRRITRSGGSVHCHRDVRP